MIKHRFEITFRSLKLGQSVQFANISGRYKDTELVPLTDRKCELSILKDTSMSIEESIEEAKLNANELIDRLSLLDCHQVLTINYLGHSDPTVMSAILTGSSSLSADMEAFIDEPLKFYELSENIKVFDEARNLAALKIYRFSLGINDDISKFLVYYGLLQILKSDSQVELDKYIRTKDPKIEICRRKRMLHGKEEEIEETIFTYIRNMIAHPSDKLDIKGLNNKIKDNIEPLRKLIIEILKNE
jgi:hypothetical protein